MQKIRKTNDLQKNDELTEGQADNDDFIGAPVGQESKNVYLEINFSKSSMNKVVRTFKPLY